MGKYSENPIDNIQGYLGNIEMMLERMEKQQKEQAAAPSPSSNGSELEELKEELSSIRTAIDTIRNDNGLISSSMKTVAGAIGTIPTEEERKRQHQEDLQYIIDNTKKQVDVTIDSATVTKLDNINKGIKDFNAALKNSGDVIGTAAKDAAEKAAGKASGKVTSTVIENWVWRVVALFAVASLFWLWLEPQLQSHDIPTLLIIIGIMAVPLILYFAYKMGEISK